MKLRGMIFLGLSALAVFSARAQVPDGGGAAPPGSGTAETRGSTRVEVEELVSGSLNIDRWAVIVGISKYQHEAWNLSYADRDAEELASLLKKGTSGGFAEDHILKLTNEKATTGAITKALRSFLKKPGKDDVVLLYFACHGASDPDRPDLVYLLTHDTDPDDISGTALPMREINTCLEEYVRSSRVVILADTCHSGAIGGGPRRRSSEGSDASAVNAYLRQVSKARGGTALLTSAEANETAREDARWGGGHGVFTHFLLEGMRGAADRDKPDGVVTLGELFQYVRDQVERETENEQHPAIGTSAYDRLFPMAITGGVKALLHYQAGSQLFELGRHLDERRPFVSAAQQFFRSESDLERQTSAGRLRALAFMALDKDKEAADALAEVIEVAGDRAPPDVRFYLGVARARLARAEKRDFGAAVADLAEFAAGHPDHVMAPWARQLADRLEVVPPGGGKRYALLVGVSHPADPAVRAVLRAPLAGPVNDIALVRETLKQSYGVPDEDITVLLNEAATHEAVTREIGRLRDKATPGDSVLLHLSGPDHKCKPDEFFFITHDGRLADRSSLLDFRWLFGELRKFTAPVTILADTRSPDPAFDPVLTRGVLPPRALVFPVPLGGTTLEAPQADGKVYGTFTYFFMNDLKTARVTSPGEILARLRPFDDTNLRARTMQGRLSPIVYGDPSRSFLFRPDDGLTLFVDAMFRPRRLESLVALDTRY